MALYIKHTDAGGAIDCTGVSKLVVAASNGVTGVTFNGVAMTRIYDGTADNTCSWFTLDSPAQASYSPVISAGSGAIRISIGVGSCSVRGVGAVTIGSDINVIPPGAVNGDLILAYGGAGASPKDVVTADGNSLYDFDNTGYGQEVAYQENAAKNYVRFTCSGTNIYNSGVALYVPSTTVSRTNWFF